MKNENSLKIIFPGLAPLVLSIGGFLLAGCPGKNNPSAPNKPTKTPTETRTASLTPTVTLTPTATASRTNTGTLLTLTPTASPTSTASGTPTDTATSTATSAGISSPTGSATPTASATPTVTNIQPTSTPTVTSTATSCYPSSAQASYPFESSLDCWQVSQTAAPYVPFYGLGNAQVFGGAKALHLSVANTSGSSMNVQILLSFVSPLDLSGKRLSGWIWVDPNLVATDYSGGIQVFSQTGPDWGNAVWESTWTTTNSSPAVNVGAWTPVNLVIGTGSGANASQVLQVGFEVSAIPVGASGELYLDDVQITDAPATPTPTGTLTSTGTPTASPTTTSTATNACGAFTCTITYTPTRTPTGVHWQLAAPSFDSFSDDGPGFSMDVDNGTLYVAYPDFLQDRIVVQSSTGGDWQTVGSPGLSLGHVFSTVIDVVYGVPYVAFAESAVGFKLTVMKFDGTNWVVVGTRGFTAGEASNFNLKVLVDKPYVSFYDLTQGDRITVMSFASGSWTTLGAAGFAQTFDTSHQVPLVFDIAGAPYTGYASQAAPNYVNAVTFNGSGWVSVGVPTFNNSQVNVGTGVEVDAEGMTPYMMIHRSDLGRFYLRSFGGATWSQAMGVPFQTPVATVIPAPAYARFLVRSGEGYVAYNDQAYGGRATVRKYVGTTEGTLGTPGFTSVPASGRINFCIDNGIPYLGVGTGSGLGSHAEIFKLQ